MMSALARDSEAAHCLDVIADETQRLERVVGDLLDLTRLEAGGDSLNPEDVAVEICSAASPRGMNPRRG